MKVLLFSYNEVMNNGLSDIESLQIVYNLFHSMSELVQSKEIYDFVLA